MDGLVEISESSVDYGIFVHIAKVPYALYSDTRSLIAFGNVVVEISRGGGSVSKRVRQVTRPSRFYLAYVM